MDSPEGIKQAQGTQSPKVKFLIRRAIDDRTLYGIEMPKVIGQVLEWPKFVR